MGTISDSIREYLPAGMCPVHGTVGAVGGWVLIKTFGFLFFDPFYAYYTGFSPWYPLTVLGVGLVGICAAVWYVVGRPLVFRLQTVDWDTSFSPRFSRGMGLAVVGGVLPVLVTGGSGLFMQALGVLGALLLTVAPPWYWVVSAVEWPWRDWWPDALPMPSGRQAGLAGVAVLVAASVALTTVVALPLVSADETVTRDGVAVTITDVQRTQSVVVDHDNTTTAGEDTELLVVEFTAENRAGEQRESPKCGGFCSTTELVSPACGTQLNPDCSEKTPHSRNFTTGGKEYATYNSLVRLEPDENNTGAVVYEVPRRSDRGERPRLTFIVHNIGRWDVSGNS